MTGAYSEMYLKDAKEVLAGCLDYMINDCAIEADLAASMFVQSGYASRFERGNPSVVAGMSGVELGRKTLEETCQNKEMPEPCYTEGRSPEYWAGWSLAEYQWASGRHFWEIFEHVPLSRIIQLYNVFHEMDSLQFLNEMEERCSTPRPECRLKKLRENRGLSQTQLSELSGVSLRSIQMYEQRVNDIDKAQAHTLYKLSRVIGCNIEDLLEAPMM